MRLVLTVVGAGALAAGCSSGDDECTDKCASDSGSSADTDTDTDADADADADTDTDADADTDTDTPVTGDTGLMLPLAGWGVVTGPCGELDDGEWLAASPSLFRNTLDLTGLVWDPTAMQLSPGAQTIYDEGTLGGSSGPSEAIAFDLLYRCELASLVLTETYILYLDVGGKKTDILTRIDGRNVGVSVTRSLTYVDPTERCGVADPTATSELILRKLTELPLSEANADPANPWERSILSVIACDVAHADEVEAVWNAADPTVKGDALMLLTVTEGEDTFLYE